jgi:VanZ family protein
MAHSFFDRRVKLVCAGLWGVSWLATTALLLLPLGGVPAHGPSDLIGHFLLFAVLAFAPVGFVRGPGQLAWLALLTIGLGAMLEYAQAFVPYRSSEIADGVANSLGGLAGSAAALLVVYFVVRPAESRLGMAPPHYCPGYSADRGRCGSSNRWPADPCSG